MLSSRVVPSLERALAQYILMMLNVVEMNPVLVTACTQGSTTAPIQMMLASSAELNVSKCLIIMYAHCHDSFCFSDMQ